MFSTLQCASMVTMVITQITVNTNIVELNEYLEQLVKSTNMKCLTPKEVGVSCYNERRGIIWCSSYCNG